MQLEQRVVLVTGAARRVGRAIALRLAQAGCRLAVHYCQSADAAAEVAEQCRRQGAEAECFRADLAQAERIPALVESVIERFGQLDVLINNASVFETMRLDDFDLARWEETLRVNLTAPMALVHAAWPALKAAGGRIVNLSDVSVAHPWPDHLAYCVSKGALDTLTRVLARALAPDVNVVGIAPGVAAWPEDYSDELRARLAAKIPLKRAGTVQDIAAAVHFVLAAGDYITGAVLPVDGGRSVV